MANYLMVSLTDEQRILIRYAVEFYDNHESLDAREKGIVAEIMEMVPPIEHRAEGDTPDVPVPEIKGDAAGVEA